MWHQIICTDLRDSFLHTVNHLLLAKLCILPKQQFFIFRSDLFRPFSKFVNRLIFSDVLNDLLRNKRDIIRAALNERLWFRISIFSFFQIEFGNVEILTTFLTLDRIRVEAVIHISKIEYFLFFSVRYKIFVKKAILYGVEADLVDLCCILLTYFLAFFLLLSMYVFQRTLCEWSTHILKLLESCKQNTETVNLTK